MLGQLVFEMVLVFLKTAENRFGDNPVAVGNPIAGRLRHTVGRASGKL
jgi:hypothetical protein